MSEQSEASGLPLDYTELTLALRKGMHTKLLVIKGEAGNIFFPEDNYQLAMNEGTDQTLNTLFKFKRENKK